MLTLNWCTDLKTIEVFCNKLYKVSQFHQLNSLALVIVTGGRGRGMVQANMGQKL
jgi:hypothetical protein